MIKTARVQDRVDGDIVNITVKMNPRHILSPTWQMVSQFKKGVISWSQYEKKYHALVAERCKTRMPELDKLARRAMKMDVYLVCFCADERICHRRLASEIVAARIETLSQLSKVKETSVYHLALAERDRFNSASLQLFERDLQR